VLAGGQSRRFGSDKAQAQINGERLLDLAVNSLKRWCETVIVVGRDETGHACVPDWPAPHAGPLGGMAGALRYAGANGHDQILTCGVDCIGLPDDLLDRLLPGPSCVAALPVIGLWPASAASTLEAMLQSPGSHAVRRFAEAIGARAVTLPVDPGNINTPDDLARATIR